MRSRTNAAPRRPCDLSAFKALTASRPLWANLEGHPSIWIRWTAAHEDQVVAEQAMTFGNPRIGVEVVGRIARCGQYGTWFIGGWRPRCGRCDGTGQVVVTVADEEDVRRAYARAIASTMDAGLYYMVQAAGECTGCLGHPGWVVGL